MFDWATRFFNSSFSVPILFRIIGILIVILIRVIVAKRIAYRGDLALIAKGYDAEDINLYSLAMWTSILLGVVLSFIIVFMHVGTFPTVKATNDLFED